MEEAQCPQPVQGVYSIENTTSGKCYIGSTTDLKKRWCQHKSNLRGGRHTNPHLQSSWDKYGESAFLFVVLEEVGGENDLVSTEQFFCDLWRGYDKSLYNIAEVVEAPFRGRHHTDRAKRKISKAHRGSVRSPETCHRISEACKGRVPWIKDRHHSEETRHKLSVAKRGEKNPNYGKSPSPETRRRLSRATRGKNNPFYGKRHTEEARRRISESQRGNERAAEPYPAFMHRETGEIIPAGKNLSKLCRERGLRNSNMCRVIHGKRSHYRGWILHSAKEKARNE